MSTESTPQERAVNAASDLLRAVNEMSFDVDQFARSLASGHRTLQQGATAALLSAVIRIAENADEFGFDERNDASVRVCRAVRDLLQADERLFIKNGVVRFPFV